MIRIPLLLVFAVPLLASAQPTGRVVPPGTMTFPTSGNVLTPSTGNSIIQYQQFSIGSGEAAKINQPGNSTVLNRSLGNPVPQIQGIMFTNPALPPAGPSGVQLQVPAIRSATEAVQMPDGRIVFRSTPP